MIILESDPWSKFFFLGRVLLFSIWSCFRWIRRLFQFNFSCQNILNPLLKMTKFSFLAFLLEPGTFALVKKRSSLVTQHCLFRIACFFFILYIHTCIFSYVSHMTFSHNPTEGISLDISHMSHMGMWSLKNISWNKNLTVLQNSSNWIKWLDIELRRFFSY